MTSGGREAARKLIHVAASLAAAAVVWRLEALPAAVILAVATTVALLVELGRWGAPRFGAVFQKRLGPLLRPGERGGLTGATTLSVGYTVAAVIFPGTPALAGILVTGVADAAAAVVGRRWGRHRIPGGKSLEGSAVLFIAALVVMLPLLGPLTALLVASAATVVEAPTLRVDDNLYLPMVVAGLVVLARIFS